MKMQNQLTEDDISIKYVEKVLKRAFPNDSCFPHTYAYDNIRSVKGGSRSDYAQLNIDNENLVILALAQLMITHPHSIVMAIKTKKQLKSIQFFLGMEIDVIDELFAEG